MITKRKPMGTRQTPGAEARLPEYRAWMRKSGAMAAVSAIDFERSLIAYRDQAGTRKECPLPECDLMRRVAGNIYEGDVLARPDCLERAYVVGGGTSEGTVLCYRPKNGAAHTDPFGGNGRDSLSDLLQEGCIVIGNAYENPILLRESAPESVVEAAKAAKADLSRVAAVIVMGLGGAAMSERFPYAEGILWSVLRLRQQYPGWLITAQETGDGEEEAEEITAASPDGRFHARERVVWVTGTADSREAKEYVALRNAFVTPELTYKSF